MMGKPNKLEPKLFYHGISLDRRIPADHPLRNIDKLVNFNFIRSKVADLYGTRGNPSVDPAVVPDGDSRVIDGDCSGPVAVDVGADEYTLAKHGDLNCDCIVNLLDFAVVSEAWLSQPNDPFWNQNYDWIPDQIIDLQDVKFLLENWLQSP